VAEILVGFVLLLYVPTLLFRFAASRTADLSRRKIANQIEDFFAAALPSVLLNLITWFIVNTATRWRLFEISATLPVLLTGRSTDVLQHNLLIINAYYLSLLCVSAISGYIYGVVEYDITYYGVAVARTLPGFWWRLALQYHDLWATFFDGEKSLLFPLTVQPTFVFVRTDRLYHGLLDRYDRSSDGEVAGISLSQASRFALKTRDECLSTDDDFATPLKGTLWLRWSTITDINIADVGAPVTFGKVIAEYEKERAAARQARTRRTWLRRLFQRA